LLDIRRRMDPAERAPALAGAGAVLRVGLGAVDEPARDPAGQQLVAAGVRPYVDDQRRVVVQLRDERLNRLDVRA
jgi:hypothetical protein